MKAQKPAQRKIAEAQQRLLERRERDRQRAQLRRLIEKPAGDTKPSVEARPAAEARGG